MLARMRYLYFKTCDWWHCFVCMVSSCLSLWLLLLQLLRWHCVECVIHHARDEREEQHHTYMWREQAIIEWSLACELYCCLLPQGEALRICRAGFLIATSDKETSRCHRFALLALLWKRIWIQCCSLQNTGCSKHLVIIWELLLEWETIFE